MSGCVLDADALIAALDRSDAHHREAASALEAMIGAEVELLTSAVNYAEALARPAADPATMRAAVDAIAALGVRTVPATEALARDAARFRAGGISLPDGFALATAASRSATVASFDQRVRRAMEEAGLRAPEALA